MARHSLLCLFVVLAFAAPSGCAGEEGGSAGATGDVVTVDRFILRPLTIEVKIKPNTSRPEIDGLRAEIEEREDIEEVNYTSQEDALEILRKRLGDDENLLPPDLAWELSPTFEITLKEDADVVAVADELAQKRIVDNSPGSRDGVSYETVPWRLELRNDETFILRMSEAELTGSYKIFRDSITLIEETGEYGVYEGEIDGTSIKFEAFPGTWEKE